MLVVNSHQLPGNRVRIEFLLELGQIRIPKRLRTITVRRCLYKFLAILLRGRAGRLLDGVSSAYQFQQRTNVLLFCGINRRACLCTAALGSLYRRVGCTLNCNQKRPHVNKNQREHGLHDFLRTMALKRAQSHKVCSKQSPTRQRLRSKSPSRLYCCEYSRACEFGLKDSDVAAVTVPACRGCCREKCWERSFVVRLQGGPAPAAKYFVHPTTTTWSGPNLHQIGPGLRGAGTPS